MLDAAVNADLVEEIRTEIENRTLQLPTLPEVALQIRDEVESDNTDANTIASIVAKDAALSARLLQVANSPLYRGRTESESIQQAVTRLGLKMVRSLVVSLAMKQIFQATSDTLDKQFRKIWDDSLQVAAISHMLARNVPGLEKEQAMLGGLVHNIGALPILTKIDERFGFQAGETVVAHMVDDLGPEIGAAVLKDWHFPVSLASIPTACLDLKYDPGPAPTYADIVLVARLQNLAAKNNTGAEADWRNVPAFNKIGMEPEVMVVDMQGPAEEIAEVRSMLES
jgi:HD-like signal output (HDOD) protein